MPDRTRRAEAVLRRMGLAAHWWFWVLVPAMAAGTLAAGAQALPRACVDRMRRLAVRRGPGLAARRASASHGPAPGMLVTPPGWPISWGHGWWSSPWIWGYDDVDGAVLCDVVTGAAVIALALLAILSTRPCRRWSLIGRPWLVTAPWLVGYGSEGGPVGLSDTVAGLAAVRARDRGSRPAAERRAAERPGGHRPPERRVADEPQRTQGPVSTGPSALQARRQRSPGGTPKPPLGPEREAANTVATTWPRVVDRGPARVSRANPAAQRRHAAPHGAVAVGVLADHRQRRRRAGRARPGRGRSRGIRESRPCSRPRRSHRWRSSRRRRARRRAARRRRCGDRSAIAWRFELVAAVEPHGRVVLPRDDVSVRHDHARAAHPARALHGQSAGRAEHAHDARRGAARTSGRAEMRAVRRRDVRLGPARSCGNGSTRDSAFRIGPDGGSASFSLRGSPSAGCPCGTRARPGVWSATAPAIQTRPRPSAPTSTAPPMPSSDRRAENAIRRRIPTPTASNTIAASAADHQRAHEAEERRVWRARPLVEQQRREPAAHEGAAGESRQRERADDEALGIAPEAPSGR